jgi:hypothetical protein
MKSGRNEPCACGSGKKTKHCCGKNDPALAKSNRLGLGIIAIVVVAAVGVIASMREKPKADPFSPFETSKPAPTQTAAATPVTAPPAATASAPVGRPGPQPPGPAPKGKVWNAEHGHWHDKAEANPWVKVETSGASGNTSSAVVQQGSTAPAKFPKPDMPTPEGMVWSPEHGHWHDKATGAAPPTQIPAEVQSQMRPPSAPAAPAGMVWSEEHKHWHKAGATSTAVTTTSPATTTNPK